MIFGDGTCGRQLELDEIMRAGPLSDGISALVRGNSRERALFLSQPHENTARRQMSASLEGILARIQPCWQPDIELPVSKTVRR